MLWSNSLQDSRVVLDTETQGKFRIESDTQVADLEDGQIGEVTHDDWVLMWGQELGDKNSTLSILAMISLSR